MDVLSGVASRDLHGLAAVSDEYCAKEEREGGGEGTSSAGKRRERGRIGWSSRDSRAGECGSSRSSIRLTFQ